MYANRVPILLSLLLLGTACWAQSDVERGLAVAVEADRRDTGFHDLRAELTMLLRNRHGEESTRQMRSRSLEVEDDGDKTMIIFDQPRDVQGTALLTFSHKVDADDQWLAVGPG